ncbi:MAG: hypothetical protein Q8P35_00680 [Candidatus Yanofskybacteria bacterium]|nr:hypothetical protein [Candidatus Yanofskybacteria bacterium]
MSDDLKQKHEEEMRRLKEEGLRHQQELEIKHLGERQRHDQEKLKRELEKKKAA